jgi:hypothetical protein
MPCKRAYAATVLPGDGSFTDYMPLGWTYMF